MKYSQATTRARFETLDGFRGIAATAVAFMHFQALHHFYSADFVRHSFLFVDFFFVLSGFVISFAYSKRITNGLSSLQFMVRRFGRLAPLNLAVLLVLILAQCAALLVSNAGVTLPKPPFTENWDVAAIPTNIFFLQAFGIHDTGTWNLPSWSIAAEFWAYLTFAIVLIRARSLYIFVSLVLIAVAIFVLIALSPDYIDATYDLGYFRCVAGFFAGVIVHRFWRDNSLSKFVATILEIIILSVVVIFVVYAGGTPASFAAPLIFAIVVWVFASERGAISSLLRGTVCQSLGRWSYSIYMVHSIYYLVVFRNGARIIEKITDYSLLEKFMYKGDVRDLLSVGGEYGTDMIVLVYLALVFSTAWLSYRFIEVPARDYFNNVANRIGRSG